MKWNLSTIVSLTLKITMFLRKKDLINAETLTTREHSWAECVNQLRDQGNQTYV